MPLSAPSAFHRFVAALRSRFLRLLLGLMLLAVFAAQSAGMLPFSFIDKMDGVLYDVKLRWYAPGGVDPRIVIVDIDEASLKEREQGGEGRWPWPRDRLALLMDRLFDDYDSALVAFDVIFSERDESSGIRTIESIAQNQLKGDAGFQEQLKRLKPLLDFDDRFAKSIENRPVVMAFSFLSSGDSAKKGVLPDPVFSSNEIPITLVSAMQRSGFTANLQSLQKKAADGGHINPIVDADGIIRRVPMLVQYGDHYYESISLAAARILLGGLPLKAIAPNPVNAAPFGSLEAIDVGGSIVPVDENLYTLVPYRGPYKSFEYISASSVLNKKVTKEQLEGKIVLIGTTAPGLLDLRATPMGTLYPGVEIHANLISGILDGNIKESPLWTKGINLGLLVLLGALLVFGLPFTGPLWASVISVGVLAVALAINLLSYSAGIVLPLASLLAALLSIYLMNIAYGYFVESRSKRLITGLFGQYVPPELVDEMAQNPESFSMEGESRELTILFSDVRGFTTISESLDAKTLSEFINAFLTPFTKVIYKNRGTIDKYMGDCIMAFWGAPLTDADHARHGLESAFEMLTAMEKLNQEFIQKGWPPIKVGIGLNSGRVSVGNMGSEIRLAYTVMGDAVNLASRLEGITKEYGAAIIIGDETRKQLPDLIAREVDKVRVKGKDVAVTIYEPLGFEGNVAERQLAALPLFEKALAAYRQQDWNSAEAQFKELQLHYADTGEVLYPLYLERIALLRDNPPGDAWDGAFTFTKK
jgi:adenylate cyclase